MRKRFYIIFVAREEDGRLRKIPVPLHYAYIFVAAAIVGAFTITGMAPAVKRTIALEAALVDPAAYAPEIDRTPGPPPGGATVELLKVLLRHSADHHGVAARLIASVSDLEHIAASDTADCRALSGWRREVFGERALALKHGQISLSLERGKVAIKEC